MLNEALKNLFTVHGLITTLLQVMLLTGCLTLYVGFQTYVMGAEIGPSKQVARSK